MKRLAVLLLALMLTLSLAACGGETKSDSSTQTGTDAVSDTGDAAITSQGESTDNTEDEGVGEITFTELVAVDNDECSVIITEIEEDSLWGFTLKTQLENKSQEKTYMFSLKSASVDGVMCTTFFASEVAPGKKANEDIYFSDETLKENGIDNYTDIELTFRVYDSDDWTADDAALETVHVYPYGEEKSINFVREAKESDNVIIDNEYVTVIVTDYEVDEIWGYTVNLFLVNKTDIEVMFSSNDVSVNGYMLDPLFAATVGAGKCSFCSMSWLSSSLEENSIEDVETIEFALRVHDWNDWTAEDLVNETITLKP